MYMVSMKDIAKQCNVSVASVSKALNGYPDISEETRQLILKTASEMGYLPNSSARALKTKRSYNLGVLFVDEAMSGLTHDYFNHVLKVLSELLNPKDTISLSPVVISPDSVSIIMNTVVTEESMEL